MININFMVPIRDQHVNGSNWELPPHSPIAICPADFSNWLDFHHQNCFWNDSKTSMSKWMNASFVCRIYFLLQTVMDYTDWHHWKNMFRWPQPQYNTEPFAHRHWASFSGPRLPPKTIQLIFFPITHPIDFYLLHRTRTRMLIPTQIYILILQCPTSSTSRYHMTFMSYDNNVHMYDYVLLALGRLNDYLVITFLLLYPHVFLHRFLNSKSNSTINVSKTNVIQIYDFVEGAGRIRFRIYNGKL